MAAKLARPFLDETCVGAVSARTALSRFAGHSYPMTTGIWVSEGAVLPDRPRPDLGSKPRFTATPGGPSRTAPCGWSRKAGRCAAASPNRSPAGLRSIGLGRVIRNTVNAIAPGRSSLGGCGRCKVPAYRQSRSSQNTASSCRRVPGSDNRVPIPNLSTSPTARTYFPRFSSLKTRM